GAGNAGGALGPGGAPWLTPATQSMGAALDDATIPEPGEPGHSGEPGHLGADLPMPTGSERIGRFRVLDRLGAGGMGVVYAAYDDKLDRKIAIKIMHSREDDQGHTALRLRREAQAMARLSHPNVVQVFEVGEYRDSLFLAMEFVRGQTLDDWLREAPRSWRDIVNMHAQAGQGLAAAHRAGLIHRDYKPSNVIVSQDGRARVLDFGLVRQGDTSERAATAKPLAERISLPDILDHALTLEGTVVGTPHYMPPEQMTGQPVDARGDQFSFCVALYEALYGVNPFSSPSLAARLNRIMNDAVAPPPPGTGVPPWVHAAVMRGLRCEPDERWPSTEALLAALASDPEHGASTESLLRRSRRPLLFGAVAFALVAVGTLLVHEDVARFQQAATSPAGALIMSLLVSSVYGVMIAFGRRTLLATAVGRQLMACGAVTCGGIVLTRVVPVFLDVPFEFGFVYGQIVIACVAAVAAVTILRPLRWMALLWLALIPLSLWRIEYAAALQSTGLLLTCVMGLVYWARR
ncbi:MAG TPA: serine/threonine-protein kinase, partial [Haliangium sp.]|nr:serine/threonine-protein kinase [Haliangium sp.]